MKDLFASRLKSAKACLVVANEDENRAVWDGQTPLAFAEEVDVLGTECATADGLSALASTAAKGDAAAKDDDETALEQACFKTARALASLFKKSNDLASLAKVDHKLGYYQKLTDEDLIAAAKSLIALATEAKNLPEAEKRGVTPGLIATLQAALTAYAGTESTPRAGIVKRSVLLRELAAKITAIMDRLHDMDDLIIQYDTTAAGQRFISSWKQARMILDAGHGPAAPPAPPAPPAA